MVPPVSVGVIGCGYWGPNLARNFAQIPGARLVSVCDSLTERRERMFAKHPGIRLHDSVRAFLDEADLDAVAIATGAASHFEIARDCLMAGKHVCVEKPLALRVSECDALIELAARQGKVLMVGHTFLYSPPLRKVLEVVRSGDLGTIRHVSCRRLNLGIVRRDIHVLWDLAAHDLSIILAIFGELPESVSSQGAANLNAGVPDIAGLWLHFSGNRSATILNSWLTPLKTREVAVIGSQKMLVFDDVALHDKIRIFNSRVEVPPDFDTFAGFHFAYHYGDVFTPHVVEDEPLRLECEHFVDCIRTKAVPLSSGKEGRDVVRILEAADRSMAAGGLLVAVA